MKKNKFNAKRKSQCFIEDYFDYQLNMCQSNEDILNNKKLKKDFKSNFNNNSEFVQLDQPNLNIFGYQQQNNNIIPEQMEISSEQETMSEPNHSVTNSSDEFSNSNISKLETDDEFEKKQGENQLHFLDDGDDQISEEVESKQIVENDGKFKFQNNLFENCINNNNSSNFNIVGDQNFSQESLPNKFNNKKDIIFNSDDDEDQLKGTIINFNGFQIN